MIGLKRHGLSHSQSRILRLAPLSQSGFLAGGEPPHLRQMQYPHGHGHNYVLEVTVAGEPDANTGMVLDLKELKGILQREILDRMDHRFLNYEVPELAGKIPTTETIAMTIWQLLEPCIRQGRLHRVRLYETPDLFVDCFGNGQ
jgi:6-pyruvoyltetrahydropterin/6-carboxytetrahydropterin synthase